MADLGTDVHFLWNSPCEKEDLHASLKHILGADHRFKQTGELSWVHDSFGKFWVHGTAPEGDQIDRICFFMSDVEMLPELATNPPTFLRPESAAQYAYHFLKELFIGLNADLGCGATRTDEVAPFNFEDSCISRLFRITKSGPQRLIRPFEEKRSIGSTLVGSELIYDCSDNPATGERYWVIWIDGPLAIHP